MAKRKNRTRLFKSDRTREWATDFMIGIGMFLLVAFFASAHTSSALPAPLARTQAALMQVEKMQIEKKQAAPEAKRFISTQQTMDRTKGDNFDALTADTAGSGNKYIMIFMALAFSALLTITISFWRNLRRAYASPRRKWERG